MKEKVKKNLPIIISFSAITIGLNALLLCNGIRLRNIKPEWLSYCLTIIVITMIISGFFYLAKLAFNKVSKILEQSEIISRRCFGMGIESSLVARNMRDLRKDLEFISKIREQVRNSQNIT